MQTELAALGEFAHARSHPSIIALLNKLLPSDIGSQLHQSFRHVEHPILYESENMRLVGPLDQKFYVCPNVFRELGEKHFGLFVCQNTHILFYKIYRLRNSFYLKRAHTNLKRLLLKWAHTF